MKVTHIPYVHPGERPKGDRNNFTWYSELTSIGKKSLDSNLNYLYLPPFAPFGCFHESPLREDLLKIVKGTLLEVELPHSDKVRAEILDRAITPCWIAEVVHMIGYYVLMRWCGGSKQDGAFWIHITHAGVHSVGFCERTRKGAYTLVPPYSIFDSRSAEEWNSFILTHTLNRYTLRPGFDDRPAEMYYNKYRVNDRIETIHDEESSVLVPAIVKRVVGRRMLLEYSKQDIDKDQQIDKENLWRDMSDDLIYPVGFATTMGLRLVANRKYKTHCESIASAVKKGLTGGEVPYAKNDATREKVFEWKTNSLCPSGSKWEPNMMLELIDRIDSVTNVLKAARVLKVLQDGYLQLGPEGPDINDDSFVVHSTSPILFPVGFCTAQGLCLSGPKGDKEEDFEWDSFLRRTNYRPAPASFFHEATEHDVPFKPGMRLEAVDQNEKMLCPGTIKAVKGRLLLVSFDGWAESYDQLYDFRSTELQPVGWGEMIAHMVQPPTSTEKDAEEELEAVEVENDEDLQPSAKRSKMDC